MEQLINLKLNTQKLNEREGEHNSNKKSKKIILLKVNQLRKFMKGEHLFGLNQYFINMDKKTIIILNILIISLALYIYISFSLNANYKSTKSLESVFIDSDEDVIYDHYTDEVEYTTGTITNIEKVKDIENKITYYKYTITLNKEDAKKYHKDSISIISNDKRRINQSIEIKALKKETLYDSCWGDGHSYYYELYANINECKVSLNDIKVNNARYYKHYKKYVIIVTIAILIILNSVAMFSINKSKTEKELYEEYEKEL